jgi:hypothetical protein
MTKGSITICEGVVIGFLLDRGESASRFILHLLYLEPKMTLAETMWPIPCPAFEHHHWQWLMKMTTASKALLVTTLARALYVTHDRKSCES